MADEPEVEREDLLAVVERQAQQLAHTAVRLEAALRTIRSYRLSEEAVGGRLVGVAEKLVESDDEDFEGDDGEEGLSAMQG